MILEVKPQREWDQGHIKNAKYNPMDELTNLVGVLKKINEPIIRCFASGARSAKRLPNI